MKNIFLSIVLLSTTLYGSYRDSKMITWKQPNGTTFIARQWGDEFIDQIETNSGYRIVKSSDGYYYYAVLDSRGEFTPSNKKVGIDQALGLSYKLERGAARLFELQEKFRLANEGYRTRWNQSHSNLNSPNNNFALSKMSSTEATTTITTVKLAVVLVDFKTSKKYIGPSPYNNGYLKSNFENLFFSLNYWIGAWGDNANPHPEKEALFGSFRDYWRDMSLGKLDIVGYNGQTIIVNPLDQGSSTIPKRVVLTNFEKNDFVYNTDDAFTNAAIAATQTQLGIDLNSEEYNAVCFVYAGDTGLGGLKPRSNGKFFQMGERDGEYPGEIVDFAFLHIGTLAHEFGHAYLNLEDQYNLHGGIYDPESYSLMSTGNDNGPELTSTDKARGACPSSLSPLYRIEKGWVDPIDITSNVTDLVIDYNYTAPKFYKIKIPGRSEYFIVERRKKDGFDQYTPYGDIPNIITPGLLVWNAGSIISNGDFENLLGATDGLLQNNPLDRFPIPPNITPQVITDGTTPSLKRLNGGNSYLSITVKWANQQIPYGKIDVLIYDEYTQNTTISSDLTISRHQKVNNGINLIIASGATLTIPEGITFLMGSGSNIVSNGIITTPELSINEIQFLPISGSSSGSWGAIIFNGLGASGSTLYNCKMQYGYAIVCNPGAANIKIDGCSISNNLYGILCYSSSPLIFGNKIFNSMYGGIQNTMNANPRIENNTIKNDVIANNSIGVYSYGGQGYINSNTINKFHIGVYSRASSSIGGWSGDPAPGRGYDYTPTQNNVVEENNYGVATYDNSWAFVGRYDYNDGKVHGGNNSIENNGSYDLSAGSYTLLYGEGNWYGYDFQPTIVQGNGAYAPWSYLSTDPFGVDDMEINQPMSLSKNTTGVVHNSTLVQINNSLNEEDRLFEDAVSYQMSKSYRTAQKKYEQLFSSKKYSQSALVLLSRLFIESNDGNGLAYFEDLKSNPSKNALETGNLYLITNLLANMYGHSGNYDRALALYDDVIKTNPNTIEERNARVQKIYYTIIEGKKDQIGAQQMLNELLATYKSGDDIDMIKNFVDHSLLTSGDNSKNFSKESKIVKVPIEYSLSQNYPNPFNPITTIAFSLPQSGSVTLKVFDALGREVATLVNGFRSEGKFNVEFDASKLSSGMYIYKLTSDKFTEVKKMMLVK
jgi:M6 family metalloprotease-like protein